MDAIDASLARLRSVDLIQRFTRGHGIADVGVESLERRVDPLGEFGSLHLIGLGQHDLITHG